jgi:hypothetical protein
MNVSTLYTGKAPDDLDGTLEDNELTSDLFEWFEKKLV